MFLGECIDMWQLDENAEKGNSGGRVGVLAYNLEVAKTGAVYLCFRVLCLLHGSGSVDMRLLEWWTLRVLIMSIGCKC